MLVVFTNVKTDRVSGTILGLLSSFLCNRLLRLVLNGKFSQECLVNASVSQGSILILLFFFFCKLMNFLTMLSLIWHIFLQFHSELAHESCILIPKSPEI